jgi:hypothetical protein
MKEEKTRIDISFGALEWLIACSPFSSLFNPKKEMLLMIITVLESLPRGEKRIKSLLMCFALALDFFGLHSPSVL